MEIINCSLDRCEKVIMAGKKQGLMGAIQIGKALSIISEGNLWLQVGAKSFEHYTSHYHGFQKSTAYNMMSVAKYFGNELLADPSLQAIEVTRLVKLLPLVTEENKLELLHDAVAIPGAQEFENQLRSRRGKVPTDECESHDFKPVTFLQCSVCGLRKKVEV